MQKLLLALAPLALLSFLAAPSRAAVAEEVLQVPDLKHEADLSVRWLRAQQDDATGRYGDGVATTAWALLAFAESPRHYKRTDGPFVQRALDWLVAQQREDGAICDTGAGRGQALEQTAMAAFVLTRYADATLKEPLSRAIAFVGQAEREPVAFPPVLGRSYDPGDRDALARGAHALLDARAADGAYWTDDQGAPSLVVTASNVCALGKMRSLVSSWDSADATPKQATPLPTIESANVARVDAALERGGAYLAGIAPDGRFGAPGHPDAGLTAMAVGGLLCVPEPRPKDVQAAIDGGLEWLVSLQHEDGSIHDGKLASYITSAAIMALVRAGRPEHEAVVKRARDFLVRLQADEGEHYSPDHPYYGGVGYGGDERPDLSNLQMALEALTQAGLEQDNPAFERARTFLQRCQNRSESNDVEVVDGDGTIVSGNDGGGIYAPGDSEVGFVELSDGRKVAISYGSMTYALLKSYLLAGVPKDDPRMQAAWEWVREHYTLDVNPGFESTTDPTAAYSGLFYYFLTMARALDLYGTETVKDTSGAEQPWRAQLSGRLLAMQRKTDGSWVNLNSSRWWEGNPMLATAYAMLTLDAARK